MATVLRRGGRGDREILETDRVSYFRSRYGVSRAMLDGLVKRGQLRKYKFGSGRSGPVVYSVGDFEQYMQRFENREFGG